MVKDTGGGMNPDVMRRIFEPFFTTREVGTGTGMGLAVVYGIVTDLKGTITVESEPGTGSTFRVFLPKIKSKAKRTRGQRTQIPTGTETILFVDDEDLLVEWARAALEKLGYRATVLTDPARASKIFASDPSRFDLVITDQSMPSMSGMQLAGKLLTIRPDIPIILCTGHSATVSPEKAREAGIREFLMKPITREELAYAVRRALDGNKEE
jgi:CheY-like chemotaxis protein